MHGCRQTSCAQQGLIGEGIPGFGQLCNAPTSSQSQSRNKGSSHLETGIQFQEVVLLAFQAIQELDSGSTNVAHTTSKSSGTSLHVLQQLWRSLQEHMAELVSVLSVCKQPVMLLTFAASGCAVSTCNGIPAGAECCVS